MKNTLLFLVLIVGVPIGIAQNPRTSAEQHPDEAVNGDPLGRGEDFLRVCVRNNYGQQAGDAKEQASRDAACNMYVWGVVSGANLYSFISPQDFAAAKKRGEASQFGYATPEAARKSAASFNLICVPDDVTVGQLRHVLSAYILKNPERSIWSTSVLVYHALTEAFPCVAEAAHPQP